jgi:glycerol-3-phosphate dehydrogenase
MGEDAVDEIINADILPNKKSKSEEITIHNGSPQNDGAYIHEKLPYTWAELETYVKNELVEHAEDLLCRRTRCILLHKEATLSILDQSIEMIADHHSYGSDWKEEEKVRFMDVAKFY